VRAGAVALASLMLGCSGSVATAPEGSSMTPPTEPAPRKANHLSGQTSPYLLQHRFNPVDWYPWGPEALAKARAENKPIFLSIGYAACHWCHVMERESFESDAVAALLNASFVAIKVDREERPDLDEIYMTAVQMMQGQGGWPLNVFVTPDGKPFFGGTYFPPDDRMGRPSFATVLAMVRDAWTTRHDEVVGSASEIAKHLVAATTASAAAPAGGLDGARASKAAAADLAKRFDPTWGGFGGAPKFPPHAALALLLREQAASREAAPLRMVTTTLDRMAQGGIYDQIGGGFARYSTDERWLVPHFEKMLYDQALLVPVYVDAWRVTGSAAYRRVAEETLEFARRELTSPDGGFYASLDADSEGHEGRFYVWTPEQVAAVLGTERGAFVSKACAISQPGTFEGASIATLADLSLAERLAPMKGELLRARSARVRPATDDKVLTAWNGLMISAYARAYEAFGNAADLRSARRSAAFLRAHALKGDRLLVSWRDGRAHLNAYLDDYAYVARAFLDLYEADFEPEDLDLAIALTRSMLARFGDGHGGFYFTSDDHEEILARTRSVYDGAIPAGSGVAVEVLARLAVHLDDAALRDAARAALTALAPGIARAPSAFCTALNASAYLDGPVIEIAVAGPRDDPATRALLAKVGASYLPARAIAWIDPAAGASERPLLKGKSLVRGKPAAYVCRNYACDAPVVDPAALARVLASRSAG
jgi:uncharacterized protein